MSEANDVEFQGNRKAAPIGVALCVVVGAGCFFGGLAQADPAARWFWLGVAALLVYATIRCIMFAFDRRVVLSIGPTGLMYRSFSPKTIAWTEITAITQFCYYKYGRLLKSGWLVTGALVQNQSYVHMPENDMINFAVADYRKYPIGIFRALARAANRSVGNPPIAIHTAVIAGSSDDMLAAIRRHWHGDIVRRDYKGRP